MPTNFLRGLQLENTEIDERFWERMRGMHQGMADDNKGLLATVERAIVRLDRVPIFPLSD